MADEIIYHEKLSSSRTEALFLGLTLLFLLLFVWRVAAAGLGFLACVFLFFFLMFLFYSLNYRTLTIRLTPDTLKLAFGLFTWRVPLDNVRDCRLDELPPLKRMGGAGIHFMTVDGRYRAAGYACHYDDASATWYAVVVLVTPPPGRLAATQIIRPSVSTSSSTMSVSPARPRSIRQCFMWCSSTCNEAFPKAACAAAI